MGIFDSLRRKKSPPNSDRKRLEKDVQRLIDESGKRIAAAEQVIQSQPKLTERDRTLIEAASISLIPVPAHLAWMLEGYNRTVAEAKRLENEIYDEYGIAFDDQSSVYSLLRQQTWWPEWVDFARQQLNISDGDSIGRWQSLFKKLDPYVYDVVLAYQTPEQFANNGPVSSWKWHVNLLDRSVEEV